MAGTDKEDGRNPGAGSGEAVEDTRSRVSEGVTGDDDDHGAEADGETGSDGTASAEGCKGAAKDEGGNEDNDEKQGGYMRNVEESGVDTLVDCMPLVHVGRSFRLACLPALILGMVGAICPVSWEVVAAGLLLYPVSVVLLYFLLQRGLRSGLPIDVAPAVLALFGVSCALLLSGGSALGGLFSAILAMGFCGMSTGEWLAVVAMRRKTGFRGAVRAAWLLEGQARERAWRPLAGEG